MSRSYTKASFDFNNLSWLVSPRKQLELEGVALGLVNIPGDKGYTFTHSHEKQEEVYMVIMGGGLILVDGETIELKKGDFVRVAPEARRALKAGPEGMFIICAGGVPMGYPRNPDARYMIDDGIPYYDDIPPWYSGDEDIIARNRKLKSRMEGKKEKA